MRDLAVIVPTRGRPDNARRLIHLFNETCIGVADLILAVDPDDPELIAYRGLATQIRGPVRLIELHDRLRLGPTLNWISIPLVANDDYRHVGFMGDDHAPRTKGWDQYVVDALDEIELGVVYGDDLVHGEALPTAAFLTGNIIQTLGYMVPRGLTHLMLDNVWKVWGEKVHGLKYLSHVVIEHMHPLVQKAETDEVYAEVNSAAMWVHDQTRYSEYVANELDDDVAKLLRVAV